MPQVINIKSLPQNWENNENMVYIGRPKTNNSPNKHFGNPFTHKQGTTASVVLGSRDEAVQAFEDWLKNKAHHNVEPFRRRWIERNYKSLKGKDLVCWCAPESCHGDVLLKMANSLFGFVPHPPPKPEFNGKVWVGVGTSDVHKDILNIFRDIGEIQGLKGLQLRSGGHPGTDSAFEDGVMRVNGHMEIYLSKMNPAKPVDTPEYFLMDEYQVEEALDILRPITPPELFKNMTASEFTSLVYARNVWQILGRDLKTPASKIICWIPRIKDTEPPLFTMARLHNIPVYNLWENVVMKAVLHDLNNYQ